MDGQAMYIPFRPIGKIKLNYAKLSLVLFYCRDFFYLAFQKIFHNPLISQGLCLILIYGAYVVCISKNRKIVKTDAVIMIVLSMLAFLFSYIAFPGNRYAITQLESWNAISSVFTFSSGIFAYLFFRTFDDDELLYDVLKPCAYILMLWAAFRINSSIAENGFSRMTQNGIISQNTYDMATGYRLMFVSVVFGLQFFENKGNIRFLYLFLSIASFAGMILYGSRTAAVSWILCWILRSLFCSEKQNSRRKILVVAGIALLFIAFTNTAILQMISRLLSALGISSRSLNLLISQNVSLDLGRSRIWTTSLEMISQHPLLGNGVFADRARFGIYCHQFFLEVLIDFGCVLGGIMIILLIINLINGFVLRNNGKWKVLFVLFFSMCIIRLAVSSSFWVDTNFWGMIGILVSFQGKSRLKLLRNRVDEPKI